MLPAGASALASHATQCVAAAVLLYLETAQPVQDGAAAAENLPATQFTQGPDPCTLLNVPAAQLTQGVSG